MKKFPFTDRQIMAELKQSEISTSVTKLCREHAITHGTPNACTGFTQKQRHAMAA